MAHRRLAGHRSNGHSLDRFFGIFAALAQIQHFRASGIAIVLRDLITIRAKLHAP